METTAVSQIESKESKAIVSKYMKTLVDVARESFLILDPDLRVVSANKTFYQNFQVSTEETENKLLYELGNGQWDIPELKEVLGNVLPEKKDVRDFEVTHAFEKIGTRTIELNAKQIDSIQWIILAMEDVTARKGLEVKVAEYAKGLEVKVAERTQELGARVRDLEKLNKSMVGRELKMVELKDEIKGLEQRGTRKDENDCLTKT